MTAYLGFLRAINLGPTRVFPKDDIRRTVGEAGFADAETYINTGNVRFTTSMRSRARIEERLEAAFAADRGFEVPTIVYAATEFGALAGATAELHDAHPDAVRHYVYLLKEEPDADQAARIEGTSSDYGVMLVRGRSAHALLGPGYRPGAVDPLGASRLLGVGTARTAKVVATLAQRWC